MKLAIFIYVMVATSVAMTCYEEKFHARGLLPGAVQAAITGIAWPGLVAEDYTYKYIQARKARGDG